VIAVVMALGTGLLIGSVSFELIDEALKTSFVGWVGLLVLVGAGVFTAGDWILDRRGASERKDPTGAQADGLPLAIVLGSVLDGIPESFVLGLTVLQGGVSLPCSPASRCRTCPRACPLRAVSRPPAGRGDG
jgi:ZIP family zinc transporter